MLLWRTCLWIATVSASIGSCDGDGVVDDDANEDDEDDEDDDYKKIKILMNECVIEYAINSARKWSILQSIYRQHKFAFGINRIFQ